MSELLTRIKRLARSPQGRGAADSVRRIASDPRKRAQAQRLLEIGRAHV